MTPWDFEQIPQLSAYDINGQLVWDRVVSRFIADNDFEQVGKDEWTKEEKLIQYYENSKGLCIQVIWLGDNTCAVDILT